MTNLLTIKEAADLLGVSTKTIRRWEQEGKITATRTVGGHRRFKATELLGCQPSDTMTVAYARVNPNRSQDKLNVQAAILRAYCQERNWRFQVILDSGDGINYNNKGLIRLIKLICSQQVNRLVLTHKNNLLRLGSDLIFTLCEIFGVEVIILNRPEDSEQEEELAQDFKEIISIFNARLYGTRNPNNKELIEHLQEVSKRLE